MLKRIIAAIMALALGAAGAAMAEQAELSGFYGQDIAGAAEAVGGLTYSAGEEFRDNYENGQMALRGDGAVAFIDLKAGAADYALCGVSVGMARADVKNLMAGYPMTWEYDEEIAWIIRADEADELNSEMLVVFFDEDGRVSGAWYRNAEA